MIERKSKPYYIPIIIFAIIGIGIGIDVGVGLFCQRLGLGLRVFI